MIENLKSETDENLTETQAFAIGMSREIKANSMDINQFQAETLRVKKLLFTHMADAENNIYGLEGLIVFILKDRDAYLPKDTENKQDTRPAAIAQALFAHEIVNEVIARWGGKSGRYPSQSVKAYLLKLEKQGDIIKFQLRGNEDDNRPKNICKRRMKYYLINKQVPQSQ